MKRLHITAIAAAALLCAASAPAQGPPPIQPVMMKQLKPYIDLWKESRVTEAAAAVV